MAVLVEDELMDPKSIYLFFDQLKPTFKFNKTTDNFSFH